MKLAQPLTLAMLSSMAVAWPVDPESTAAPDTIADCTYWAIATAEDTCQSLSEYWGLSEAQLTTYVRSIQEVFKGQY